MSSKTEILKRIKEGKELRTTVPCPEPLGELEIRALTQLEVDQVNDLLLKGQEIRTTVTPGEKGADEPEEFDIALDMGKVLAAQAQADRLLVACALSVDEKWKPDDAGALPPAAFRMLLAEAKRLTGPDAFVEAEGEIAKLKTPGGEPEAPTLADVRTFRDDTGGADDARPASRRRAAGAKSG